ncbi:hypothetical protein EDC96DRAFT_520462 [Choanephora cucurbitarum]|nr:hypothetical protein EDC96DRAFT_520462 [Choanephora cucurbitarum]
MSSSIDNSYAITDTTAVKSILENIASEKNWSKEDVTNDLSILARNRIHHVHDLRALSSESWAQIELLPLVKDLLRNAIDSDWPKNNTCNSIKQVEDQLSEYEKKKDKKKKDEEDEAKKKKKDKKKKGGSLLGSPVEPAILTDRSVSNGYLHDNSSDTSLISQDPITIENTIRNANVGNTSEEEDNESDESEEYNTPTTPVRRKSVSFSDETSIINDIAKKEKKKDKKNKKKKKEKGLANPSLAYPYTHRPIVNIHHQPSRNYQTLPPVPPDDSFLQSIHDKLVSSSTTVDV